MLHITLAALVAAATFSSALPSNPIPQVLTEKDVIVFGANGRVEVMKRDEYHLLTRDLYSKTPASLTSFENTTSETIPRKALSKRCKSKEVYTMNPDVSFINWDVPMSPVVKSSGDSNSVSVTQGFSISNSITVSSTISAVADFLTASFGISYTETWQTSFAAAFTFQIPNGKFGAVVSNPATTRKTGHVDIGCIGEATERVEYQADSYTSQSFGGLGWVEGTISLCTGDVYPLKMCIGDGTIA